MLIFVYGTLRDGCALHRILERLQAKYCGKFITEPTYTMVNLGSFPGIIDVGHTSIIGEVYDVSLNGVTYLDYVEQNYRRQSVKLYTPKNRKFKSIGDVQAYFMPIIASGDWYDLDNNRGVE